MLMFCAYVSCIPHAPSIEFFLLAAPSYSNIFVTSPTPENLRTLFEFVFKGFDAIGYKEHQDYELVQSTNPEFNNAIVRVNIFKSHRQTIQVRLFSIFSIHMPVYLSRRLCLLKTYGVANSCAVHPPGRQRQVGPGRVGGDRRGGSHPASACPQASRPLPRVPRLHR